MLQLYSWFQKTWMKIKPVQL